MGQRPDAVQIANTVSLIRDTSNNPVILVEGETDSRLYPKFFMPDPLVRFIPCQGKPVLLGAMEEVGRRRISRVLAICDADYDRIFSKSRQKGVFYADCHDAEMMMIKSDSFPRAFREIMDSDGIVTLEELGKTRDALLEIACRIGELRAASERDSLSLNFKNVNPGDFLKEGLQFDLDGYIGKLLESGASSGSDAVGLARIVSSRQNSLDPWEISSGHDLASLISAESSYRRKAKALRLNLQVDGIELLGPGAVEMALRQGYDWNSFSRTSLASSLAQWEEENDCDLLNEEI